LIKRHSLKRRIEHKICVKLRVKVVTSTETSTDTTHLTSACYLVCQNEVQAMYKMNISLHFNRQNALPF